MDRRTLLKTGGLAALGLGVGSCATRSAAPGTASGRTPLLPVRAEEDRIIRTTVGLRPHRPRGFRVEAERLDGKTVIHNYGHGGAGMSLSWGTAALAADLAVGHGERRAAILGCGVVGLTTASELQRRGFRITIYAGAVPPDTTSNMSFASFTPTSALIGAGRRTPAWDAQFREAVTIAYRRLQLLAGSGVGVSWIDFYAMRGDQEPERVAQRASEGALLPASVRPPVEILGPGEHPFPVPYVAKERTLRLEPSIYLTALVRDVRLAGGEIVIRRFGSLRDVAELDESLILNCTGLGARDLVGDAEMMPVKGQLTVLVPQPEVTYGTIGGLGSGGGFPIHMLPRADGVILGGTAEWDEWSLTPNDEAQRSVMRQHREFFDAMRAHLA